MNVFVMKEEQKKKDCQSGLIVAGGGGVEGPTVNIVYLTKVADKVSGISFLGGEESKQRKR